MRSRNDYIIYTCYVEVHTFLIIFDSRPMAYYTLLYATLNRVLQQQQHKCFIIITSFFFPFENSKYTDTMFNLTFRGFRCYPVCGAINRIRICNSVRSRARDLATRRWKQKNKTWWNVRNKYKIIMKKNVSPCGDHRSVYNNNNSNQIMNRTGRDQISHAFHHFGSRRSLALWPVQLPRWTTWL